MDRPTGQERFTTEIVLDRFRGELTLLDSNRDIAGEDDGGTQGHPAATRQPAATGTGSRGWGPSGDLDDETPFGPCWQ